jgi:hypothetical protein
MAKSHQRRSKKHGGTSGKLNWTLSWSENRRGVTGFFISLFLFFVVIDPIHHTFQFAEQVKVGHAGSVSAGLFGLPLVRLRADEVRIASAGKAGEFPAVDRLSGRRLIYLGEANSKAMLYDPVRRVTFSMPAASLVLELRGG